MSRIIAITGGSGAGKTTIARALAAQLPGAALIGEDDYYRCATSIPNFDPHVVNFDEPAAKDEALLAANIADARAGKAFDKPLYDFVTHTRKAEIERIAPADFLIIEGILLLAFPSVRPLFDLSVYIDAEESLRLGRRMIRDVETRGRTPHSVMHCFFDTVRPMHELHVAPQKALADVVIQSLPADNLAAAEAHAAIIARRLEQSS